MISTAASTDLNRSAGTHADAGGWPSVARVLRAVVVLAVPVIVFTALCHRVARPYMPEAGGPGEKEQLRQSFEYAEKGGYECLILGNSRIYRGVNPDRLGVSAYNFGHTADSFNQGFYKLKYLDARGIRFKTLILGVDYFEFALFLDSADHFYGPYLGPDYLKDFADASRSNPLTARILHPVDEEAFNAWMTTTFTRPATVLMELGLSELLRDPRPALPRMYLKPNGQYMVDLNIARQWDVIKRDATKLPIQDHYFHATLEFARARNIRTVLLMPPMRESELKSYKDGEMAGWDAWLTREAADAGAVYLNYATDPRFTIGDFADITHLSEAGADKFSSILAEDLARLGLVSRPAP